MFIDFLVDVFRAHAADDAIVWRDQVSSYGALAEAVAHWGGWLSAEAVAPGTVVSLEADFSPVSVALLLALVERGCIVVPLTPTVEARKPEFRRLAEVEAMVAVDGDDRVTLGRTGVSAGHVLYQNLRAARHPGLVLFSSGSTGASKAAVHDFVPLLAKFAVRRHALRTLTFLLFDHIGGVNTLLYALSNGGCLVTVAERSPDRVCAAIEKHRVQLLPTSPTFLNLLLVSEAYVGRDLSSLELVTYGTEVMPESTLARVHGLFPGLRLLQTYGLSEVGILRSQSRASDSLWVKVGGEGFETRVVDGLLQIRARSAMLGYLNAPSPFTADGWFATGDVVDVDGDYLRIRGRQSEIINVGGEKVYPAEVETVLQTMDGVADVIVAGEAHPLTGQIVTARVRLTTGETLPEFRARMRGFCRDRLPAFKIPQKVRLVEESLHGGRFKKLRTPARETPAPVLHELREIDPRVHEDVAAVTALHMTLLGHGPMARLGERFLREFCYGTLVRDGLMRVALFEVEGQPAGFVAWTSRSITFHRSALRRHALRVAWLIARTIAGEPRVIRRLGKAVWLMVSRRAERDLACDPLGEVLSIGVLPEYRTPRFLQRTGLRIGEALVRHAMIALRRDRVAVMRMVVEAHNTPTLMLYHALGARFEPYAHAGEPMVHVWFDL